MGIYDQSQTIIILAGFTVYILIKISPSFLSPRTDYFLQIILCLCALHYFVISSPKYPELAEEASL